MKYIIDYIIFELYWKAKFSPNRTYCNMSNTFIIINYIKLCKLVHSFFYL